MKNVLATLLFVAISAAYATAQEKTQTVGDKSLETTATIKYYGEKAGLFRPCKGTCSLVCKEISQVVASESKNIANEDYQKDELVIISDGKNKMTVPKSRVNFKDGSVK